MARKNPGMSIPLCLLGAILFSFASAGGAEVARKPEPPDPREARMAWWREARFGMFIHWGLYSIPAGEWEGRNDLGEWFLQQTKMPVSQYEKFAGQFTPSNFNASAWARLAKRAGMRYVVITSKHHDGFCLWDSSLTDWDISRTPFLRDPLAELRAACTNEGLRFGLYYSILDWHHPDWGRRRPWNDVATGTPSMDRYAAYVQGQIGELVTRYKPSILWFDGPWEVWPRERGDALAEAVRSMDSNLIISDRVGARPGFADFSTPEQMIPTSQPPGEDWETCMTMNDHWGYNKQDQNWKSTAQLIRDLIECASESGNFLLNVGPTAAGAIPEACVQRLSEIGRWLEVNGEAIYGTAGSPFRPLDWGRCTVKRAGEDTRIYLHVFTWPPNGNLLLPEIDKPAVQAYLLSDASRKPLKTVAGGDGLTISVPPAAPDPISSTVVVVLKGSLTPDSPRRPSRKR